ncbi:ATP-binding protein [Pseudoalteromonas umbrosa]|uniref:ATP-binding protein n=1 Tax=Pseudoalteromonas umbrosa TaxID=3048489 RepID=UPI0024C44362|nr:ATP-binding protein [Pseudoalteromonas sp. B95]MDK1286860.1 ATP-binding protein [Pseudoalteromonas sp. B95]
MNTLNFNVDSRLATLLSENYRSVEAALKELVDNSWDADSEVVVVKFPEPLSKDPIIIEDDGSGMTEEELKNEYLLIARNRRSRRGQFTPKKYRKVKGRKGIGKFAGLMCANRMIVETWTRGTRCKFEIDLPSLNEVGEIEVLPLPLTVTACDPLASGTKITLLEMKQNLAFPDPAKFRQKLLQDYGRENDFKIVVNDKEMDVDDLRGSFVQNTFESSSLGKVNLKFTIADKKSKVRKSGIAIRVAGKVVGEPSSFGLEDDETFPAKLLNQLYGEVEADGLIDHVTADWGALIENSQFILELKHLIQPIVKEAFQKAYSKEMNLAQARLAKKVNERLEQLPEFKRQFADDAIRKILQKYYGEPESKLEPIVNVILDAIERSDYRMVIEQLNSARNSEIAKLAEALEDYGIAQLSFMAEQAATRLSFLDALEELCLKNSTLEAELHRAIENNMWLFGPEYSMFSSNITLRRQIEDYLNEKYTGDLGSKRPDLLLNRSVYNEHLLIEFKRPKHSLSYLDYQQATTYRNEFTRYTDKPIRVMLLGGKRGGDLPRPDHIEANVEILVFDELISAARYQLDWLLSELTNR